MNLLLSVFYNSRENRVRALWRLSIQTLLMLFIIFTGLIFTTVISMIIAGVPVNGDIEDVNRIDSLEQLENSSEIVFMSTIVSFLACIISVWIAAKILDKRNFKDFGLNMDRNWWSDFYYGLFLGGLLITIVFLFQYIAGWIEVTNTFYNPTPDSPFLIALLLPVMIFVLVGIWEELLSRGYHIVNMSEGLNSKVFSAKTAIVIATIISSGIFSVLHILNPETTYFSSFNLFLAGIFLASGYIITGQLALPIGLHITWNLFQGNVFGFPVSGMDMPLASFITINQMGPDLWTGGAYGPEGGILGILAMGLGIILIILWTKHKYGKANLNEEIAHPPMMGEGNNSE